MVYASDIYMFTTWYVHAPNYARDIINKGNPFGSLLILRHANPHTLMLPVLYHLQFPIR